MRDISNRINAHRLQVGWRSIKQDAQRWPLELAVNVILASPLVPRVLRAVLLRALGMDLQTYDIYPRCTFRTTKLKVGKGSIINVGCHFDNNTMIEIGTGVQIAMGVTFVTTGHKLGAKDRRAGALEFKPIVVGDGCSIGANVTVLPGVQIGEGCVIGAGSVVRTDCAPNGLYVGVPAERVNRTPPRTGRAERVAQPQAASPQNGSVTHAASGPA